MGNGLCAYDDWYGEITYDDDENPISVTGPYGKQWTFTSNPVALYGDYEYYYGSDYESSYDYYYDYSDEYVWSSSVYSTFLTSSEYDGWAAMYTPDWESWYLWDQSGSICNLEMDWVDIDDMDAGIYGFTVKNDDGTCIYDEFYSTTTYYEHFGLTNLDGKYARIVWQET
jgi:hypothetical protein